LRPRKKEGSQLVQDEELRQAAQLVGQGSQIFEFFTNPFLQVSHPDESMHEAQPVAH
jgi:hypothetical protein